MTYYNSSHLCDDLLFRVPTTTLHHPLSACPSPHVEGCGHSRPRPVDHATSTPAMSTTPHPLSTTSTTLRQPHTTYHLDACHVNHDMSTSTTPHRFRPRHIDAATSTLATSTSATNPPHTPMTTGHEKRRTTRRGGRDEHVSHVDVS